MLLKLLTAVLLPLLIIYMLYFITDLPNKTANGFNREFLSNAVDLLHTEQLPLEARRVAGISGDTVYLETDDPGLLLASHDRFEQWYRYTLPVADSLLQPLDFTFHAYVQAGQLHIVSGNQSTAIYLDMRQKEVKHVDSLGPKFINAVPISPTSYVVRQFTNDLKYLQFIKLNTSIETRQPADQLPIAGRTEWLSTDGQLLYDSDTHILAYAHYYGNEVISFDTTLHLAKRFHTIDQTPLPDYDVGKRPKQMTIQAGCAYQGMLFLASNLKADNEPRKAYLKNIPIDRYDLSNGTYRGSFYVPTPGGSLIKSMAVASRTLIVLYHSNQLSVFRLPD